MKKFGIYTLWCLCTVLMACGTAFAQTESVVFSTINNATDNCTGCNYSNLSGFLVLGPQHCLAEQFDTTAVAQPFYAQADARVTTVFLALTDSPACEASGHEVNVAIYSDNCDNPNQPGPGTQIGGSVKVTVAAAPCGLTTANFNGKGVQLLGDSTRYWLVVKAGKNSKGTTAVWWNSNYSFVGTNDGSGWVGGESALAGFQVNGE